MELAVEQHGNRFKIQGDHFYMDGVLEDIPQYVAELHRLAPPPEKVVREVFRRHMYMPVLQAVIAVQWDGKEETYMYLNSLSRMRGCYAAYKDGSKVVNICMVSDYQGGIDYKVGDWAVFNNGESHVSHLTDEAFATLYIRMPLEG